jgi:hypothetical protein
LHKVIAVVEVIMFYIKIWRSIYEGKNVSISVYLLEFPFLQRKLIRDVVVMVFFSFGLILPAALCPWGRLSLQQKRVPGIFLRDKRRPERKADLIAICELIVYKMWEP